MALAAAAQLFEHKLQPLAVDSERLPDQYISIVQNHCREYCWGFEQAGRVRHVLY